MNFTDVTNFLEYVTLSLLNWVHMDQSLLQFLDQNAEYFFYSHCVFTTPTYNMQ
jgi:hypothetical protein